MDGTFITRTIQSDECPEELPAPPGKAPREAGGFPGLAESTPAHARTYWWNRFRAEPSRNHSNCDSL